MSVEDNIDYLIAGGGIAGLYSALKLIDNHHVNPNKIILVEKSWRFGGRIYTKTYEDVSYDLGGGRLSENNYLTMELINELGLSDKLIQIKNGTSFIIVNEDTSVSLEDNVIDDTLKLLENVCNDIHLYSKEILINTQLCEFLYEKIGYTNTHLLMNIFGYDTDFYTFNAYEGILNFKNNFDKKNKYYVLNGGLSQITDKIVDILKSKGVIMYLKTKLIDFNDNVATISNIDEDMRYINCKNLILALPQQSILQFCFLKKYDYILNSVIPIPMMRVYAIFPLKDGKSWFDGLSITTTNLNLRKIIPINSRNGLCMISYCDGKIAENWQKCNIDGSLQSKIMYELRAMFTDIDIPDPTYIDSKLWDSGVHNWKIGYDHKSTLQKLRDLNNIYICGEAFSDCQGWVEGALRSVNDICGRFKRDIKNYTLEEVSNSNSLTIINNKVYDLSINDWISKHPGGEIIKKSIGRDGTFMFNYINHPDYAYSYLDSLYVGNLLD